MRFARLLFSLTLSALSAASQEPPPSFEVTSVKRNLSGEHARFAKPFPTLHIEAATLRDLINLAYHIHTFELIGGPVWMDTDLFDIDAKAEHPPTPSPQFANLQWSRLQALLHDRFNLTVHRETKTLPVYELIVAKGGVKAQPATCLDRITGDTAIAPGKKDADYCGGAAVGRGRIDARGADMRFLTDLLVGLVNRPVVNKTGLAGKFEIHLAYTPDAPAGEPAATADVGPDIFTALQQQLGLRLQPAKAPVEVLVIDRVEKPTGN